MCLRGIRKYHCRTSAHEGRCKTGSEHKMNWEPPESAETWKAIELYLSRAYAGDPPLGVRARLDALRSAQESEFYRLAAFERSPSDNPTKFSLRLGNRHYPHMKMVIERSPDGMQTLFQVDTHDRHVQPKPDST